MTAVNTLHQDMPATGGESLDLQALTRALLESALNAIMDEQADMACEGGANSRNGYRERGLVTPAGKITLRIPKLRCGTRGCWRDTAGRTRRWRRLRPRCAPTGFRRARSSA